MISMLIIKFFECFQTAFDIINREIQTFELMFNMKKKLDYFKKNNLLTADIFSKHVKTNPNKPCIIYNDQTWTFKDVIFFCILYKW